jgi:hypothetical protein
MRTLAVASTTTWYSIADNTEALAVGGVGALVRVSGGPSTTFVPGVVVKPTGEPHHGWAKLVPADLSLRYRELANAIGRREEEIRAEERHAATKASAILRVPTDEWRSMAERLAEELVGIQTAKGMPDDELRRLLLSFIA